MKVVLTGSACAGKSTLLGCFERAGYLTFPEAETPLVQELRDQLGVAGAKRWILDNYTRFKELVADRQRVIDACPVNGSAVFYDRSAICYIAYCHLRGAQVPRNLLELADVTRPDKVFFLESLAAFDERRSSGRFMSKDEASCLADLIRQEYTQRGTELVDVPEFSLFADENLVCRRAYIEGSLGLPQTS